MLLKSLNDRQKEAVLCTQGPLLIIAGAGSGKTRVLTHRIAYIIKELKVPSHKILAVTFTNKAAAELKHRLARLIGVLSQDMWVGTFHSICGRILRRDIDKLGYGKNFVIFDTDDQRSLMKKVIKDLNLDDKRYKPAAILDTISTAKNNLIKPDKYIEKAMDIWEEKVALCYKEYQDRLQKNNALDFDDMLMMTVELLSTYENIRTYYQDRFEYLSVDEYQDTNHAQYMMTSLLAKRHTNICVVGDDDQSIYSFRGADVTNILDFENDYPKAKVIKLEENYRSTKNILDIANIVIANNEMRKSKNLWTQNEGGNRVITYLAPNEKSEARFIIGEILKIAKRDELNKVAILYRTNAQSRVMEEILLENGLPYKIVSGFRFYERKEIKDLLSYLKVIFNPQDSFSLNRVFAFALDGIGKATISKLEKDASDKKISMFEAMNSISDLPKKATDGFRRLYSILSLLRVNVETEAASKIVEEAIEKSGMLKELEAEGTEDSQTRIENIKEFLSVTKEFEEKSEDNTLGAFLTQISLVTDQDSIDETKSYITLMTLHAAKGLEYPIVFIAGFEEGVFPHFRSMFEPKQLEEERRLCYVGITRAKETLYLTHAVERMLFGQTFCNGPSRFLDEIPKNLLDEKRFDDMNNNVGAGMFKSLSVESNENSNTNYDDMDCMYNIGDMINHPKFGPGEIVKIEGSGENMKLDILFSGIGKKTLLLKYANLNRRS